MLPDFLIVGTMKGGTSALYRGMMAHPDVFTAHGKEMHFFDLHFDKGNDWYAGHFADAAPGAITGEATPDYMYGEHVIERMTTTVPKARLIAILRNPVDRTHSHYWHNVRRGRESLSFSEALQEEPQSLDGDPNRPAVHFAYVDRSRYLNQLHSIERRVGREQLLVLRNDDLRRHRAETLRSVWSFIGVDPEAGQIEELKRPVRWHLKERLSPGRRARAKPYPALDPSLRNRLVADALPDVEALEEWWGRDLSDWKR